MHKSRSDPKVKKTLVRNCESQVKPTAKKQVIRDVNSASRAKTSKSSISSATEIELDQPTLCSSRALAHYLSDAKISAPPALAVEDVDRGQICAQVTKKLNFHFNDRIYKNLIELNTNVDDLKKKKDKRPSSSTSLKRDLEPNIEDFYEDLKDKDTIPNIPVIKSKYKAVKNVENGQLHKLVSAFEYL